MDFRKDLIFFLRKIESGENFTLVRYGDGEHMLCDGIDVGKGTQADVQDHWTSKWKTKLWEELSKTLDITDDNFRYALPCDCCAPVCKQWYLERIKSKNITFANVFINANYQPFKNRLLGLKREVMLIANYEWKDKTYPFPVKQFISIPDDCVNYFEKNYTQDADMYTKLAKSVHDQLFFVSAWPMANIIIFEMFNANPDNTYIDLGSALDEFTKNRITRWFQNAEWKYASRYCRF